MFPMHAEVAVTQLCKQGEELCGDTVEIVKTAAATIIVLSDGLGSGVKANILATLTTKIAASMLKRGIALEDVVDTIAETLPVCRQRKIAYSTLHIIIVTNHGDATVVEFDSPASFLVRNGRVVPFPTREIMVSGKLFKMGTLTLREEDIIVAVSDGVVHAGIGGLLKLGWGWQGIAAFLSENDGSAKAQAIGRNIIRCCEGYYLDKPGDDATAVVVKIRYPLRVSLFTGPPIDRENDEQVVKKFLRQQGKKIVAGGTTANIVSRETGRPLKVDLAYVNPNIPPIGYIEGIDLVTEGVLTLNAAADIIMSNKLVNNNDGASLLANLLLEADIINIFSGGAINAAHQNPNFPARLNIKVQVVSKLKEGLEARGKQVFMECF